MISSLGRVVMDARDFLSLRLPREPAEFACSTIRDPVWGDLMNKPKLTESWISRRDAGRID
jgi:hypothetical protein